MARRRKRGPRRLILALFALAIILIFPRFYPPLRHPVDAAMLLQALFAGEEATWLAGWKPPPRRLAEAPGGVPVDLYLPAAASGMEGASVRGCVLLAHGMTDMGRSDPRLIAFARNVARLGFAAAVPELPGMRRFRPDPEDVDRISKSFLWMDKKFSRGGMSCGLFAFSFAAGPAMKAAARPELKDRAAYFIGLGAYFDLKAVLRYLTTGGRGDEPAFPGGPPIRVGKWLFLRYNVELLGLSLYEAEIERIIRLKLADENADISPFVARLPGPLKKLLALIENRDPRHFEDLFGAQPPGMRAMIETWSMRGTVPKTRMPVFLLHGRSDPFVPSSESLRLAAAARRRGPEAGDARVFIAESLGHVDPGGGRGSAFGRFLEAVRLVGFISRVLTTMEGGGAIWRSRPN